MTVSFTAIPFKAPHLITLKIDDSFHCVVNTWFPQSLRLLNNIQISVLDLIDGSKNVEQIADLLKQDAASVLNCLTNLGTTEIVKFDESFTNPLNVSNPKSLDLWIHTTNRCNLTCDYCYISTLNTSEGMSELAKDQLIKQLVLTASNRKLTSVKIRLAGGEPLTQFKSWKDFIIRSTEALKLVDCKLYISFLTNLTILNDEIIQFSKAHNISFGISLDGVNSYHNKTRKYRNGNGSFDIVDRNIDLLLKNGIKLSVSSVITNDNMDGLSALTNYFIQKEVYFRFSIVKGDYIDRNALKRHLMNAYILMEDAINKGWKFSQFHKFCDLKPNELDTQTCSSGRSGGSVYIDGGIYYCHVQFGNDNLSNGTIFQDKLDLLDLISVGTGFEGMKSHDCTNCNYKHICTSGCPMYRVDGKDLNCEIYHEFIPVIYRLQAKERLRKILQN